MLFLFYTYSSGGGSSGIVAKDKLGNDVIVEDWLKTHGPNDRTLVQGLRVDSMFVCFLQPTKLILLIFVLTCI